MADSPSELQFEIEKLERKHAEHPEGRFFVPLANAYRKMGDVETAEALLRNGVERHPDYLSAHIVLGRCLADRGAVREAEEEFRFVLSQDPQNLIALRTLGELASGDGRTSEAAEWYRELLAVDPMNEDARQALDALSDAPAGAGIEEEFRTGAGWWQGDVEDETAPLEGDEEESAATLEAASPPAEDRRFDGRDGLLQDVESGTPATGADAALGSTGAAGDDDFARYGELSLEEPRAPEAAAPSSAERKGDQGLWSYGSVDVEAVGREGPNGRGETARRERMSGKRDDEPNVGTPPASVYEGSPEMVTETIAELYARQGLYDRAAVVYRELIRRRGGDTALEQRLAEIERLGRDEQAAGLEFADDEALLTPPLDGEAEVGADEDPFAASFAAGFTTIDVPPDEADSVRNVDEPEAGSAVQGDGQEEAGPAVASRTAPDASAGAPISEFLAGLAAWRPASAGAVPSRPADEEEAVPDLEPWEAAASDAEQASLADADGPADEPWGAAAAPDAPAVDEESWRSAPAESVEGDALPWEQGKQEAEQEPAELADLDQTTSSAAEGGTGRAEEEPFPWELPGESPARSGATEAQTPALDPFFVDDVEPSTPEPEEALPQAAPARDPEARPEPESPAVAEPDEDEDLESFQAWLRSLKR